MSFEGLQERLIALQETAAQLKDLIQKLQDLEYPPESVPQGADDDNAGTELSSEISQILREEEEELELLQEEVEDLRSGRPGSETEHNKMRLRDGVSRLTQDLKSSRVNFRKAQLAAKRSLSRAQRLERELFLQSFSQPTSETSTPPLGGSEDQEQEQGGDGQDVEQVLADKEKKNVVSTHPSEGVRHRHHHRPHGHQQGKQQSSLSEEDKQTVGASGNVTSALRRTHDIIAAELARSEFAQQTLAESSAALSRLDESYGSLEGMLASSRDLLGTLVRSQKSDTWYLQTALYMLVATGAWLFFRRLLWGPAWWLVWLPARMFYQLVMGSGSAVMKLGGGRPEGGPGAGHSPGVVVEDARVRANVEGMPGEELPTVGVQGGDISDEEAGRLINKIGRVVDAESEMEEGEKERELNVDEMDLEEGLGAQEQRDEL